MTSWSMQHIIRCLRYAALVLTFDDHDRPQKHTCDVITHLSQHPKNMRKLPIFDFSME